MEEDISRSYSNIVSGLSDPRRHDDSGTQNSVLLISSKILIEHRFYVLSQYLEFFLFVKFCVIGFNTFVSLIRKHN